MSPGSLPPMPLPPPDVVTVVVTVLAATVVVVAVVLLGELELDELLEELFDEFLMFRHGARLLICALGKRVCWPVSLKSGGRTGQHNTAGRKLEPITATSTGTAVWLCMTVDRLWKSGLRSARFREESGCPVLAREIGLFRDARANLHGPPNTGRFEPCQHDLRDMAAHRGVGQWRLLPRTDAFDPVLVCILLWVARQIDAFFGQRCVLIDEGTGAIAGQSGVSCRADKLSPSSMHRELGGRGRIA